MKNQTTNPPTPLIHNKKEMKKIVAKHEDVMDFFERIKVGVKVKNKKTNEKNNVKSTKNQQEDYVEI